MKPLQWIVAGLLAGASGSASAFLNMREVDFYAIFLALGLVIAGWLWPLLYVAFRKGMAWADKGAWILLLLIVDIVMGGLLVKLVGGLTGDSAIIFLMAMMSVPSYIVLLVMGTKHPRASPPSDNPAA